jgi:class 3 adenylate cyclase/tetratricopeptide (TPR) repeat protein
MTPARRERKVVTVLFADLVDFTSRAETLDPEDVEAILRPYHERLRSELERFGGTVEKFIGDAAMALFGAPVAHEDDPERAVRAALAIRDWARDQDVQVRIAVNTGEALISLDARPESGEGMAAGDVVNTAARMQTAAPTNGIVVGEATYRATRGAIDYREAGTIDAKGKSLPVTVWEVVEARARVGEEPVSTRTPLVGRDRELTVLRELLVRVREESSPQLATLVGVPGIGKSRLVRELMEAVEQSGVLTFWRQGRSLPYGEGVTFWALAEMVKAQAGVLETDSDQVSDQKLAAAVADLLSESAEAKSLEEQLRPLVGAGADVALSDESRPEAFAAWRRFFEAMAERRPLVLVFEDLHWADDGLVDFVDHLAEWSGPVPMLIVCTARPELLEKHPSWGGGKLNATTLSLSPLSDDETARLLGSVLPRPLLEADDQRELIGRAGGNPLYAEQYAQMIAEGGSPSDAALPETVQGIIAARLDRLPAAEKTLLHDAAVHGKVFWVGGVAGGRSAGEAAHVLHRLERKGFIQRARRSSVADEREYGFLHVLVRDVAYGQIPRADRAVKHVAAARWIESLGRRDDHAEMLAHHYGQALELMRAGAIAVPDEVADRAGAAFADAGERALTMNASAVAAQFYENALALSPDGPSHERAVLEYRRAIALFRTGDERRGEELEYARDSLLSAGDRDRAAEAESLLAEVRWLEGDLRRRDEHLARATELVRDAPPSAEKARVLAEAARFQMLGGETDVAIRTGQSALVLAEQLGLDQLRVEAMVTIGTAKGNSGDMSGVDDLEQALEIASGRAAWRAYNNLAAMVTHGLGDVPRAQAFLQQGLAIAENIGDRAQIVWFRAQLVLAAYEVGDFDGVIDHADAVIAAAEAGYAGGLEAAIRAYRARVRLARDDVTGAAADAERAIATAAADVDPLNMHSIWTMTAVVLIGLGRRAEASELIDRVLDSVRAKGPSDTSHSQLPLFAEALVELDRSDEFADSVARMSPSPWVSAAETYIDGRYAEAADLYATLSVADEAWARLRAARSLLEAGARAEADVQLQKALAFFRSAGATRCVREGEALLAATA